MQNVALRERVFSNFDIKDMKKPGFGGNIRSKILGDFEPREAPYVLELEEQKVSKGGRGGGGDTGLREKRHHENADKPNREEGQGQHTLQRAAA